jgi:hypothetical protein
MTARKHTDAAIMAGIAEATAAWQAPQDTTYFAERFGYTEPEMLRILARLADAGHLTRRKRRAWGSTLNVWSVTHE